MSAPRRGLPKSRFRLPRAVRRLWPPVLVAVVVLSLVAGAIIAPGFKLTDLRLHDGTIFAVKQDAALLGTVNTQIKDLSAASRMADPSFDVLQEGRTVVVRSTASNLIQAYDPAAGTLGSAVALPAAGEVALNAGKMAVVSRLNGAVWFGPTETVLAYDFNKEKALLDLGENAQVIVTTSGELIGLSLRDSTIVRIRNGQPAETPVPLALDPAAPQVELSAVGDNAVILDRGRQQIWFEGLGKPIELTNASTARLAKPAPATKLGRGNLGGIVATSVNVLAVSKDHVDLLSENVEQGTPQSPVVVGDCMYAVIGTRVATACAGSAPTTTDIPKLPENANLELRVNRDVVVLNDLRSGYVWLVNDGMRLITDWTKVSPTNKESSESVENEQVVNVQPNRTGVNHPPVAKDDSLAARAGRSTSLPILDNDSDPDGDLLVISSPPDAGAGVKLELVRGGAGLQATIDPGVTGTRSFTYTINDGRGGSASAKVTLTVLPADQSAQNQPPVQWRKDAWKVPLGGQSSKRVLLDWRDPEGDDLVLVSAKVVDGDDEVSFTPDGTLTFTDVGKRPGIKQVQVEISDGLASTTGILTVDALKPTEVPPLANGDFATASTNAEIEIKPLLNDEGANLTLMNVEAAIPAGPKVTPDYAAKSFRFSASQPGTYYVGYKVSSAGPWSYGLVRIDVSNRSSGNRPPIAVRDVALLTHGGSVTIDPLLNDEDPDGDVLAIQTYSTIPNLQIEMRERHLMTIKEITALSGPVTITYQLTDGSYVVPGTIVVIPSKAAELPPIAVPDDVNVRAGDSVTVFPMQNDYSPVGLDLTLDTQLTDNLGGAWADGDSIRFVAPNVPGRVTATYQVKDSLGRTASAQIRFNVISLDVPNLPPTPVLVTGRVLAGTTAKVLIPLQGIDPNGDSVRLVGIHEGPRLGRVLQVGTKWIEYEAYKNAFGTDKFSYDVIDAFGAKATGEIRVGVIQASDQNTPPTAVDDFITVKPGRAVYIQPLLNDYDVDGDKISFTSEDSATTLSFPFKASIVDKTAITFQAPNEPGTYVGTYNIIDSRKSPASGKVVVTVDDKAPLQPPRPSDDMVSAAEVFQRDAVDVPVLANDFDPDGPRDKLKVSVAPDQGATVVDTAEGQKVRVTIGDRLRTVRYTVTDEDNLSTSAFVIVPGKADALPTLREDVELTVTAGDPLKIPVNQYVQGTQGRKVKISTQDLVVAAPGSGRLETPTDLIYQSSPSYSGPAAISFEVQEDVDPGTRDARSATVSIRIKVLPRPEGAGGSGSQTGGDRLNAPPTVAPLEVKIGAGEAPITLNLNEFASDPEGDQFTFGRFNGDMPPGVRMSVNGSVLTASADISAVKGTRAVLTGSITDSKNAQSPVTITAIVTPSTLPRASAADDAQTVNQGQTVTIPVTANDKSVLPDSTLTVVSTAVESGDVQVTQTTASSVTVKVGPNYTGVARIRYTVQDATKDNDRNVDARIVLTVLGRPTTPGTPRQVEVGDGYLTATWTSSVDNGSPISNYTMTASPGGASVQCGTTTTCKLTGLQNAVKYTVSVVATNAVGTSDPSAASAEMMPDVRPERPSAPSANRGPGPVGNQLEVTWEPAKTRGTPVTSYQLQMDGGVTQTLAVGSQIQVGGDGRFHYIWTGLANGADHTFTLSATNQAGTSDVSPASAPAHASAPPNPPGKPSGADNGLAGGGYINVWWSGVPADQTNGDPVTKYVLYEGTSAGALNEVGTFTEASAVRPAPNGATMYYAVAAVNAAGTGARSAPSDPVTAFGAPSINGKPGVEAGDHQVKVTLSPSQIQANGAPVTRLLVATCDNAYQGEATPTGGGLSYVLTGLPNDGNDRRVKVTPVTTASGQTKTGADSECSDYFHTYGNPVIRVDVTRNGYQNGAKATSFTATLKIVDANGNRTDEIRPAIGVPNPNIGWSVNFTQDDLGDPQVVRASYYRLDGNAGAVANADIPRTVNASATRPNVTVAMSNMGSSSAVCTVTGTQGGTAQVTINGSAQAGVQNAYSGQASAPLQGNFPANDTAQVSCNENGGGPTHKNFAITIP